MIYENSEGSTLQTKQPIAKNIPPVAIDTLVDNFTKATAEGRVNIINSVDEDYSWQLVLESKNAAVEAVRQNNYELIRKGLILHSIENSGYDWRDNLIRLTLLYHCAKKLDPNPDLLFKEIAGISQHPMNKLIEDFLTRNDKTIEAMGYIESYEPEFDYKQAF